MKRIKLVIFDLDGTLVDAYQAIFKSFKFTMKKCAYPLKDNLTIRRAVGWGDGSLLSPFVKAQDLKHALSIYRKHHKKELLKSSRLFPGAEKVLRSLKAKGYKLAVASNRPTRFSLILIRHLGIASYFDYCLFADKLKHGKPHPEILNRIRKKFSLKPNQVVYVGDMAIDLQAGGRARIKTIAVSTGSSTPRELRKEKPYRIIRRIVDLLQIL